jgi:filamentous hemagglutinin family protein
MADKEHPMRFLKAPRRLRQGNVHDQLRGLRGRFTAATAIVAAMALPRPGLAGPSGGTVVGGSATISQSGSTTNINQSTNQAVINWQSFSIAPSETVNFHQPSSASATLNRVIGNEQSVISGALNANGQVFIVNSAGVLFTRGAQVNVGGLVASTLDISNQNFMAGNYSFSGNSSASVVNQGRIHAHDGGYVALLGKTVANDGVIVAKLGTVAMASGSKITLNFAGNSLVDVTIDQGALNALVANRRAIIADGGRVIMTAKAADQVLSAQVNNSGIIQARTMASLRGGADVVHKGSIKLLAQGGTVTVSGKLDASAPKGGDGGAIETSGDKVKIADSATITAKAAHGQNGSWLIDPDGFTIAAIGGDISGATLGRELAASNVTIASTSGHGIGGNIDVNDTVSWSAGTTLTLNATNAINVNAVISGPNGGLGLNAGTDINVNAPSSLQVATLNATAAGNVNINAPQTWTNNGSWTFSATNINVNDQVSWSAGTLTMNAGASGGFINVNAPVIASGRANLAVTYNTGMDTSTANGKPTATYGTQLGGINPLLDPSTNTFVGYITFTNTAYLNSFPANATTSPLTINRQPYTLITSIGQPTLADGVTPNPHDLSYLNNSSGNFALAGNLDAGGSVDSRGNISGTVYSAAPIGVFSGNLEGLGHTVSNLVVVAPAVGNLGLIGTLDNLGNSNPTTVRNIGIVNVLIQDTLPGFLGGSGPDGALVGMVNNGIIVNAFATGNPNAQVPQGSAFTGPPASPQPVTAAIAGGDTIGGLVGFNAGIIVNSHADVSVYGGSAGQNIGGFVGTNTRSGVLLNDYSTGTVSAGQPVDSGNLGNAIGGFVGFNSGGVISNSYTTSQVWSLNNNRVGGFVGQNIFGGIINNSSSSGAVNIQWTLDQLGADGQFGGGFVGDNFGGTINNSFTSSNVTYPGFPTFTGVGVFGGQQAPHLGNANTTNSTGGGTVNGQPGPFYGTDSGMSTNVNVSPPGSSPPPGQGVHPPPSNAQQAANARAQAQALTQQATAQQVAVGQAQVGVGAANVASTSTSIAAASPPNGTLSAAGTSAATSPSAAAISANFKAVEANVQADDQRARRRFLAAATTPPRRNGGGLGATIRNIEINGHRFDPKQNPPKGAPDQNSR